MAERHVRSGWSLPLFASMASLAFVVVMLVEPTGAGARAAALQASRGSSQPLAGQTLQVDDEAEVDLSRDGYGVTAPPTPAQLAALSAPAVGKPDPGTAQAIAYELVKKKGWSDNEFNCLVALWNKESHWNVYAHNPSSGAYGIPQALPGSKMATVGSDWKTNPKTQIVWGLGYIQGRYGTPCGAWSHSQAKGWY